MQREWNPKSFFRNLTPGMIVLFTESAGLTIDMASRRAAGLQLFEAWKALPADQQRQLEERLLPVNDMCSPHARPYLEEIARERWTHDKAAMCEAAKGWSVHDLALRLFLDDPRAFEDAHKNYVVDTMSSGKEYRGREPRKVAPSPLKKQRFAQELERYFRDTALGARCQVEDHANDEKLAVFVYHEAEVTPVERFDDAGALGTSWQRPVLKMAAVFHFDTATLHVKAARKAEREKLRDLFAALYVGEEGFFGTVPPAFSFKPLRQDSFQFPVQATDKIVRVSVVKVIVRPSGGRTKRLAIDLQRGLKMYEVHQELILRGVDLATDAIEGVQLCFEFVGTSRSRTRTINIYAPNTTNLQDTPRDRVIRRYLRQWGIDATVHETIAAAPARHAATG